MTRAELLAVAKPILFNTEMVRAIKDNRKTVTRRVVKPQPNYEIYWKGGISYFEKVPCDGGWYGRQLQPQYNWDDVLYVSEAWRCTERCTPDFYEIEFQDGEKVRVIFTDGTRLQKWLKYIDKPHDHWQSPYFMPKEAARLFLRVTGMRVERLQEITNEQALAEGMPDDLDYPVSEVYCPVCKGYGLVGGYNSETLGFYERECPHCDTTKKRFSNLWDTTIKPADRSLYGWDANPWVWAVEFERVEEKA